MSYSRAAPEATREHGLVAGTMTGAWQLAEELERLLGRTTSARPELPTDLADMAHSCVEQHGRCFALIRALEEKILELQIPPR